MNVRENSHQHPKERLVRVFISSTFRDMQEERDYLVKQVFPDLRKRCRERAVEFVEVDLRWGVTEEQAERGEVLPICLREIELCRPYFIGLLGERYGWVPDKINPQLIEEQPWLAEHKQHSVTALEMVYGVLKNPGMAHRAYFYFRDPAYVKSLPEDRSRDYLAEDPEARARLAKLKDRIRASGLPLKENYPDPEAVGQWILEDLWQVYPTLFGYPGKIAGAGAPGVGISPEQYGVALRDPGALRGGRAPVPGRPGYLGEGSGAGPPGGGHHPEWYGEALPISGAL